MSTVAGTPAGYREELLPRMPSLGRLYAQAVGRSRAHVLTSRPLAGRGLPPVVLRVDGVQAEPGQLSDYQHLLGEPGTDVLPAGYVHVLAFPLAMAVMVRPDFPLPVLGMVHVANRVEQRRALRLGEGVTVRAWAQDARPHARGTQVDLVVSVSARTPGPAADDAAAEVWRGTSTYLAKRRLPGLADAEPGAGDVTPGTDEAPGADDAPSALEVPTTPTALWRLPAQTGRDYAEVSGDRNPIHVSRLGARLFGFRRPIAHGMYTAARALAATAPVRGESFDWAVTFAKPVLLPTTVAFAVERPDGAAARFGLWDRRSGKPHLTGSVTPTDNG